jgi:CMP/dCMP kinase
MSSAPFVIALDGPAASGKSTVGLGVAQRLGLRYFDTGLLYRALTWLALRRDVDLSDAAALVQLIDELAIDVDALGQVWRERHDITPLLQRPEVDLSVSTVAAHPMVRRQLVPVQRALVRPPGLVMAGRDIGTVIVPDAPLKVWLSASAEERARRRAQQTGENFDAVLDGMRRRDQQDASREASPMARAPEAIEVETDDVAPEQVIARIVELAHQRGLRPVERA